MNTPSTTSLALPIIIIAGGQSQRLQLGNYDRKWQLPFGDETLLQHMLNLASQVSNTVLINSSHADTEAFTRYKRPIIHEDISQGPLSGILCALQWGKKNGYSTIMTLPCDTPFLDSQWLYYLHDQYKLSTKKAVISAYKERSHPLCGVWSTQLCADLASFMQNNEKKAVYRWANRHAQFVDYKRHNTDENLEVDPFMNINTQEDYEKALRLRAKTKVIQQK